MRNCLRLTAVFLTVATWNLGCVATESTVRPTPPAAPESTESVAAEPAPSPGAQPETEDSPAAEGVRQSSTAKPAITPEFDHKAPYDSIDWATTNTQKVIPQAGIGDREWPGEKLGLIGPIVAHSGTGGRYRFVMVYDPAGVLVGAMTLKEFKQHPERFDALLEKAHQRAQHQNRRALQYLIRRQHIDQALDAANEKKGASP